VTLCLPLKKHSRNNSKGKLKLGSDPERPDIPEKSLKRPINHEKSPESLARAQRFRIGDKLKNIEEFSRKDQMPKP
jgi:hypothetical protein